LPPNAQRARHCLAIGDGEAPHVSPSSSFLHADARKLTPDARRPSIVVCGVQGARIDGARSRKEYIMIGETVRHYEGKSADLGTFKQKIEEYLQQEGFKTQSTEPTPQGTIIQAQQGNWLTAIIAADRALTILIEGQPTDFTVKVGIGRWLEHLGVTAVETLLISPLFLIVDVPETLWNLEIESKLVKQIDQIVEELPMAA
jgi:hypothetical protein